MKQLIHKIGKLLAIASATALALPALAQQYNPPIDILPGMDIAQVITRVVTWVAGIAGGIAVLFIIYGGVIYIVGGEKGSESGKKIVLNAVIGLVIIILAVVIVGAISRALGG